MSDADFSYVPPNGRNSPEHQKRMMLAMLAMVGVVFVWTMLFPPNQAQVPPDRTDVTTQQTDAAESASAPPQLSSGSNEPLPPAPAAEAVEPRTVSFQTRAFDLAFSNVGGGISRAVLKSDNPELWKGYKFEQVFKPGKEAEIRPVDLARVKAEQTIPGACEISGDAAVPFSTVYQLEERQNGVTFRGGTSEVTVEKTFDFADQGYDFRATYKVTNNTSATRSLKLSVIYPAFYDPQLLPKSGLFAPPPDQIQAMLLDDGDAERMQAGKKVEEKTFKGPIQFVGFDQRYFLGAAFPTDTRGTSGRLFTSEDGRYEATLVFDLGSVAPGQTVERGVGFFIGRGGECVGER